MEQKFFRISNSVLTFTGSINLLGERFLNQSDLGFRSSCILLEYRRSGLGLNDLLLSGPGTWSGILLCHNSHRSTIIGDHVLGSLIIDDNCIVNTDLLGIRVETGLLS